MAVYASTWDYIATQGGRSNYELAVGLFSASFDSDPVLVVTF